MSKSTTNQQETALDELKRMRKRDSNLRRRYGITYAEYEDLLTRQLGRCAICDESKEKLMVDHCHTTKLVRGLLCLQCNSALGYTKENINILIAMTNYLLSGGVSSKQKI